MKIPDFSMGHYFRRQKITEFCKERDKKKMEKIARKYEKKKGQLRRFSLSPEKACRLDFSSDYFWFELS